MFTSSAVQRGFERTMVELVEGVIRDDPGEREKVRAGFLQGRTVDPPTTESVIAFATEVERRYGSLERVTITSMSSDGGFTNPVYSTAMVLYFRDDKQRASARFVMPMGTLKLRLTRIVVVDAQLGDVRLPRRRRGRRGRRGRRIAVIPR